LDPKSPQDIKKFLELFNKTKLTKPVSLFIYGLLADQNLSGYDIYRLLELKGEAISSAFGINKATIYNTLKKMEKLGHIKIVKVMTDTNRPPKTIYKLTKEGRQELRRMILNDLEIPPLSYVPFLLDLSFAKVLTKEELKESIKIKIEQIEFSLGIYEVFKDVNLGAMLRIIAKAKRDMAAALLKNLKEMQEVVESMEFKDLFKQYRVDGGKLMETIDVAKKGDKS